MSDRLPQQISNTMTPRQIRILKISIAVMSVLLVAGLIALVFGMARQASRASGSQSLLRANTQPYEVNAANKTGDVRSLFADQSLLILYFKGEIEDRIVSYDPISGREYGHFVINKRN